MFTKEFLFGMNIITLLGFAAMGISLTLRRMSSAGVPLCLGLMSLGTVLVFIGLYAGGGATD